MAIYELASDEDDVFLVSELVRGRTLAELTEAGAISDRDVARIGAALCEALEHAHARGVIHRDVKPQNVMVLAEPAAGAGFAKLADFGVAHVATGDPLTHTGDVVGTLAYMAPEQAEGVRVTPACDVYSLALTLYEAWTGTNPVKAGGPAATARRLGRPLPRLASLRRDLPLDLCDTIDDALEVDPVHRPAPARLRTELRAAESQLADEGGLVEPATLKRVGLATTAAPPLLLRTAGGRRRASGRGAPGASDARARARRGSPRAASCSPASSGSAPTRPSRRWWPPASRRSPPPCSRGSAGCCRVIALCAWLVSPGADMQGTALVLAAAALPVPFLLPRAGVLWSVPVIAPLLGTIALAPAFIGVAALAPTAARRAGLAAAGLWWLLVGEAITGRSLLFGSPTARSGARPGRARSPRRRPTRFSRS